jgi:hypothetical protein
MAYVRLTEHARQRCREMGISTKVPKRIVDDPARVSYPGAPGHPGDRRMIASKCHPEYLVILQQTPEPDEPDIVVTVLYRTEDRIPREEANRRAREALAKKNGVTL